MKNGESKDEHMTVAFKRDEKKDRILLSFVWGTFPRLLEAVEVLDLWLHGAIRKRKTVACDLKGTFHAF